MHAVGLLRRRIKSLIASLTLVAFAVTQVGLAPQAIAAQPELPLNLALARNFQLSLPPELGTIETIHTGMGPTLIHIQTAHGHYEAQKKIQSILHY